MKKLLTTMFTIAALLITASAPALAQQMPSDTIQDGTINGSAGTTNDNMNQTQTGGFLTDSGIDWRLVLPLLAVPLIFLALMAMNKDNRNNQGFAGLKGGEARARRESM